MLKKKKCNITYTLILCIIIPLMFFSITESLVYKGEALKVQVSKVQQDNDVVSIREAIREVVTSYARQELQNKSERNVENASILEEDPEAIVEEYVFSMTQAEIALQNEVENIGFENTVSIDFDNATLFKIVTTVYFKGTETVTVEIMSV